jgi:drug/metabolite transporter (DMT)-like permease
MHLPELYAFTCALLWAISVVMMRFLGERIPPNLLNLIKNSIGLALFIPTIALVKGWENPGFTGAEITQLMISGVIGVTLADTLYLTSLKVLGAGRIAVIACLYSPLLAAASYFMLKDEVLTIPDLFGFALVVLGILVADLNFGKGKTAPTRKMVSGVLIGVAAMSAMALGIVWIIPLIQDGSLLYITAIRLFSGVLAGIAWQFLSGKRHEFRILREKLPWGRLLLCGFIASYLAMLFWIAGFRSESTATAAVLNQTSTLFIILFGVIFLKESFGLRKGLGALTAIAGVLLVSLW